MIATEGFVEGETCDEYFLELLAWMVVNDIIFVKCSTSNMSCLGVCYLVYIVNAFQSLCSWKKKS